MNFGNLHVGQSTTLTYQIGNANPGGPNLIGAIQTNANGGNITDALDEQIRLVLLDKMAAFFGKDQLAVCRA